MTKPVLCQGFNQPKTIELKYPYGSRKYKRAGVKI